MRLSVLQSAFRVLMDRGRVDDFTIAEVAARAGVHETSIYRRWGTKNALIRDACVHYAEDVLTIPDTGSLRADIVALLDRVVAAMTSRQGRLVLTLSMSQHPHVVAARRTFWERRFDLIRPIFDRAVARGEFPRDVDPIEVVELLIAPLYLRLLLTGQPPEDWPRNQIIDRVLRTYAARSGSATTRRRSRRSHSR